METDQLIYQVLCILMLLAPLVLLILGLATARGRAFLFGTKNLLCVVSGHRYQDEYRKVDEGKCQRIRTCTRCGKQHKGDVDRHLFEAQKDLTAPCDLVEVCQLCKYTVTTPGYSHRFEMTGEQQVNPCTKKVTKQCSACGELQTLFVEEAAAHKFQPTGRFITKSDEISETTFEEYKCELCGKIEDRYSDHRFFD